MAALKDLSSIWKNIKEIDLKPIRDSAIYPLRIALVGGQGAGKHTLAEQMRTDPARPGMHTQSPLIFVTTMAGLEAPDVHLIILMIDATRPDLSDEQLLVKQWSEAGKNVLVFINKLDLISSNIEPNLGQGWQASRVLHGSVNDIVYLQREFIPTVLELLPQQHIALGRQFPLFRIPIARQLINETCLSNAAYSFSTGLAEIVPVLDLPLNVTDLVVLTKSQAFLAYKLGLLVGFSTRWQDYVTEFGSVIGSGFVWRQIARSLIGLIPAWGIIPKVAVAYSGTYVVGNAILGWYLTGRKLSPKQMQALSVQAFTRGKEYARKLGQRIPKPRLSLRKKEGLPSGKMKAALPEEIVIDKKREQPPEPVVEAAGEGQSAGDNLSTAPGEINVSADRRSTRSRPGKRIHPFRPRQIETPIQANTRTCQKCGKASAGDAQFCQYCGAAFES